MKAKEGDKRIGNQFWLLRSKHGRDKLFTTPELLWQAACEYFQWCIDNPIIAQDNKGTKNVNEIEFNRPFTLKGFCLYCDATENWFKEFRKSKGAIDFLSVIHKIEDIIYLQKFEGAVIGIYKENIIARDLGLKDHSDITTDDEKIQSLNIIVDKIETAEALKRIRDGG